MSLEHSNRLIASVRDQNRIIECAHALVNAPRPPESLREQGEVTVELYEDELKAYITLYVKDVELMVQRRADLFKEILTKLKPAVYNGIKNECFYMDCQTN